MITVMRLLKRLIGDERGLTGLESAVMAVALVLSGASFAYAYVTSTRQAHKVMTDHINNSMQIAISKTMGEELQRLNNLTIAELEPVSEPSPAAAYDPNFVLDAHVWMGFQSVLKDDIDLATDHLQHAVDLLANDPDSSQVFENLIETLNEGSKTSTQKALATLGTLVTGITSNIHLPTDELYVELSQAATNQGNADLAAHYLEHLSQYLGEQGQDGNTTGDP